MDKLPSSLQTLRSLAEVSMAEKSVKDEDYFNLKREHELLVEKMNSLVDEFGTQAGTGSPEGSVTANHSLLYVDTSANQIYYNTTYGANTGWTATV